MGERQSLTENRLIPGRIVAKRAILESWCYTRRNGAASIQAESRPIPGNSRWCSAWLNFREGGGVLSYTRGQQAAVGLFEVLRLYQGSVVGCIYQVKSRFCLYQVTSRFCLYQVTSKILFIPGHFQDSVYIRSLPRFCLYQVNSKILFIPGGVLLFTPASVGRRALGRPIHACQAIATVFA